jgi:hypothetical protein
MSKSYPAFALARVIDPSMDKKNGFIIEPSGDGSSNSNSANVLVVCRRKLEAFLSTL